MTLLGGEVVRKAKALKVINKAENVKQSWRCEAKLKMLSKVEDIKKS